MKIKSFVKAISTCLLFISSSAHSVDISIIEPGVTDFATTVGGYNLTEYKDADGGGGEWSTTGTVGGNATQLWLFSIGGTATTTFTQESTAVAFMMQNDFNDGIARFFVDGVNVLDFDTYMPTGSEIPRTFIFSGLESGAHELSFEYLVGGVSPNSQGIALYGGAALSQIPVPAAAWLFGSALLGLCAVKRRRA